MPENNKTQTNKNAEKNSVGFADVLRAMALGIAPTAPRLPEQALANGMFGGYPKGYSNTRAFRGTLNFSVLREIGWRSPVLSAIISTRLHQTMRYSRPTRLTKKNQVGFKIVHKREHDPHFTVPEGFKEMCRETEKMFEKPWRVFWDQEEGGTVYRDVEPTFSNFLSAVTEDYLVINRPVIELGLDVNRTPRAFGAIDGANVLPTFNVLKFLTTREKDMPKDWGTNWSAYRRVLQMASDRYKLDIDEKTEYIYLLYGRPAAAFRHDELLIGSFGKQTDVRQAGYPRSLTERAIFIILSEIMAMSANSRYFEFGSMAESMVALKGNYDDQHVKDIEQIFQGNLTGVPGMYRLPLIALPGGADDVNVINLKQNHRDMLFDIYIQKLTNLGCAVFRMHPSEINEAPRAGDNAGGLQQASQTKQINMAQEQGHECLLLHLKTSMFDPILERIDENMMFEWDNGENELEQLEIMEKYASITKVDERRQMMALDPIGGEEGEVIDNTFIMQTKQMEQQQQMQEQQMQMQQQQMQQQPMQGDEQPPSQDEEPPEDENRGDDEDQNVKSNEQSKIRKVKKKKKKKTSKEKAGREGFIRNPPWSEQDEKETRRNAR